MITYIKQIPPAPPQRDTQLRDTVQEMIDNVRDRGDAALRAYAVQFDRKAPHCIRVSEAEIRLAMHSLTPELRQELDFAAAQIRFFAEQQLACMHELNLQSQIPGVTLGHTLNPVDSCGCYVPGGRYPLPSAALMNIIPAKVAGVKRVAACSPAPDGHIHPTTLAAMRIAGANEIYAMGGAQAIAALAYGTGSVPKVDMIVGPGNRYVAEAKRQVLGDVGIDSIAGPSEVLIVADSSARPDWLAMDLLAQSEHDPNSRSTLICTDRDLPDAVANEITRVLRTLPTAAVAAAAWKNNGQLLYAETLNEALAYCDAQAPEHVELHLADAQAAAKQLHHYGSLFIGAYAPVALGDYVSGPNHTLPTAGTARFSGGLWVGTFIKTGFWQQVTAEGCAALAPHCTALADMEGLAAHAISVRLRTQK